MNIMIDYSQRVIGMLLGSHCGEVAVEDLNEIKTDTKKSENPEESLNPEDSSAPPQKTKTDLALEYPLTWQKLGILKSLSTEDIFLLDQAQQYIDKDLTQDPNFGSLARVAPLAMMNLEDVKLKNIVESQTLMSHENPEAILADWVFIKGLREALQGQSKTHVYETMIAEAEKKDAKLFNLFKKLPYMPWEEVRAQQSHCYNILGSAVWALLNFHRFEESLLKMKEQGGIPSAMLTGALCGAYYSIEEIPERWVDSLPLKNEILFEAESLIAWKGPVIRGS
jgi:hypothetical protein